MAQNTPETHGSPYWTEPPEANEEMIQEKDYRLDSQYWKQNPGPEQDRQNQPDRPAPWENAETMPEPSAGGQPPCMAAFALAMAYIPRQKWGELYQPDVGFIRGTIFPALDKPFIGEGGAAL